MANATPSREDLGEALGVSYEDEDPISQRMNETSTAFERRFWEWVGVNPDPELVIDRPKADEISFRGALEEMGEGARELAFEWMEQKRVLPDLNKLERKLYRRAVTLRREGNLEPARTISRESGLPVKSVIRTLFSAASKFYLEERREILAQMVV